MTEANQQKTGQAAGRQRQQQHRQHDRPVLNQRCQNRWRQALGNHAAQYGLRQQEEASVDAQRGTRQPHHHTHNHRSQ